MSNHASLLRRVGEGIYGPRWQSDLSDELGISTRTMRGFLSGDAIPDGIWDELLALVRKRAVELKAVERDIIRLRAPR